MGLNDREPKFFVNYKRGRSYHQGREEAVRAVDDSKIKSTPQLTAGRGRRCLCPNTACDAMSSLLENPRKLIQNSLVSGENVLTQYIGTVWALTSGRF